ncbi:MULTISPECIES: alpha/beta fold hydrolase [Idiomarina]|jgi:predicted alpha/beta hydrolase|uniref:alpha/beta hydrolase family protein n=1 Tax=Idiomarina TaxID=135575 RepID=UPI000C53BC45|nr:MULTISPECIES: alpha/beta fold hydrolase [Idiomarina]MAO69330.1 dehydrogenase [Idiomarina sp.]MBF80596.1 dehydrogenase [Idiomarina sp.]|tara:strand:+ start:3918 stop:4766 length:849 start_codon:yes stop_codon:yes gene_type:complete
MKSVELTANNRYLHCVRFEPESTVKATIVIAAALGVKQRFYQPIARWLSEKGYRVITFDYYGIGQSVDKPLKQIKSDIIDWAELDITSVLDYAQSCQKGEPLIWLAHSLGGQIIAMAHNANKIDKMVTIASGTGYWLKASKQVRWTSWLLWYFAAPISTPIAGYFPGKRLNMVGDMPAAAMKQWSRWCRSKDYLFDNISTEQKARYKAFSAPISAFHIADDELLQRSNIENLLAHYPNADKVLKDLTPEMAESKGIGHFNFFRSQFKESLWRKSLLDALKVN